MGQQGARGNDGADILEGRGQNLGEVQASLMGVEHTDKSPGTARWTLPALCASDSVCHRWTGSQRPTAQ